MVILSPTLTILLKSSSMPFHLSLSATSGGTIANNLRHCLREITSCLLAASRTWIYSSSCSWVGVIFLDTFRYGLFYWCTHSAGYTPSVTRPVQLTAIFFWKPSHDFSLRSPPWTLLLYADVPRPVKTIILSPRVVL